MVLNCLQVDQLSVLAPQEREAAHEFRLLSNLVSSSSGVPRKQADETDQDQARPEFVCIRQLYPQRSPCWCRRAIAAEVRRRVSICVGGFRWPRPGVALASKAIHSAPI